MGKPVIAAMLCALALGVLVAGCGDDEEASSGGSGAAGGAAESGSETDGEGLESGDLSKAEFVRQANAICKDAVQEVQSAVDSLSDQQKVDPEQAQEELATAAVAAIEGEVEGLSDLGAPDGDGKQLAALLDALEEAVDEIEANSAELAQANATIEKATKRADTLGIEACPFG